MSRLVKAGFYAFLDYAILHWVDHLETFLKTLETIDLNDLDVVGLAGEDFSAINNTFDAPDLEALAKFDLRCEEAR